MFDGVIYNMLTDGLRAALVVFATDLGLTGTTNEHFVAGGLYLFAGLWAWYENRGHQLIVNALKRQTGTNSVGAALQAPRR